MCKYLFELWKQMLLFILEHFVRRDFRINIRRIFNKNITVRWYTSKQQSIYSTAKHCFYKNQSQSWNCHWSSSLSSFWWEYFLFFEYIIWIFSKLGNLFDIALKSLRLSPQHTPNQKQKQKLNQKQALWVSSSVARIQAIKIPKRIP